MIQRWGVRARVMLVAVLPMLVLAVVLTALYTSTRLADLDEAHAARGQAFARQLAVASEYAVFSGNHEALRQMAGAILAEDDVMGVTIVDGQGEALAKSGRLDSATPMPAEGVRLVSHGATLRIIEPIVSTSIDLDDGFSSIALGLPEAARPHVLGQVVLDVSRARLTAKRRELLYTGVGSVLLMLVASLALARYMSIGVTGPIRRIAQAVERIGRGDFSERLPPVGGGSLETLAQGVNQMAAQLASAHEDMQRKVEEATAELRARKEEAERADRYKSRFLAAASHDLRQPMHALGLFVAELSRQNVSPPARRLVERIAASAEAMEDLLDSLLDLSKLDAGALQPNVRDFALRPLIERIVAETQPSAGEDQVILKARAADVWVRSDPVLLQRILGNLLTNAVRYARGGRVLVACRRRGASVRIEVRDNGMGIAPEQQEAIFLEFVQLDNPARTREKGLGLGLAIVRRLTDLLGHRLQLRSAPGKGSVFAVEVELARPELAPAADATQRAPGDLAGLRVVLIDGDTPARDAMENLLASWECDVSASDDAASILANPDRLTPAPQLVISDFRLPGPLDGIEAIRALRTRYGHDLPAVLISGDTGSDISELAHREGVPVVHKPVRPARLRALLNRLLAHE